MAAIITHFFSASSVASRTARFARLLASALLLSACMSSDEKIASELEATIEATLHPGDDAATIERVGLEKGWRLRRMPYGYMGYSPDSRVSTKVKSLQIWIQVDDHQRFVGARVEPYRQLEKPFH
jgi:hypothetical protein